MREPGVESNRSEQRSISCITRHLNREAFVCKCIYASVMRWYSAVYPSLLALSSTSTI